ncbi:MAG: hypothetical protein ACNA8L_12880 [Luteolibacter sp.]
MSKTSLAILTAFITFICTSILWVGVGLVSYRAWLGLDDWLGDEVFQVELETPMLVKVGEVFSMQVKATNTSEDLATLGSIDVYDSLLDGFEVLGVSPEPKSQSGLFGFQSYYFDGLRMKPGESTTVTFELKAAKPGMWQGDVDCCTPLENFTSEVATIMVSDAADQ